MRPGHTPRWSFLISIVLLMIALIIVIQFQTFENIKDTLVTDPEVSALSPGLGSKVTLLLSTLTALDWIIISALAAAIISMIVLELRKKKISLELESIFCSEKQTLLLVAALSALACRFYISPGLFSLGDSSLHVYRAWGAAHSFSEGHYPFWSFFNYGGFPFLQFYGPLFYLLVASTGALFGSIDWSAKIWLFLLHWGSAFPIYYWARALGGKRGGAVVAALAYVLSFQHTHTIIWTGALQMSGIYFTFPLVLLSIEKILRQRPAAWPIVLSISTASMILFHQGYAVFGLQLAFLYIIVRWIIKTDETRIGVKSVLLSLFGLGAGVFLCSIFLWNIVFNHSGVYFPSELPLLRPGFPTLDLLKKILLWRNLWSGWTAAYMGISLIGFAAISSFLVWNRRRSIDLNILRSVSILALFALLCSASGGRTINLALAFIAVLAFGVTGIAQRSSQGKITLILLVLLFIDLGPTTVQSPFRSDHLFIRQGMENAAVKIKPHRALYGYSSQAGTHYFNWSDSRQTDLILPTGFFPQGAPHSLNAITGMVDMMNESKGVLTEEIRNALYLWDVAALLTYTRTSFTDPAFEGLETAEGDPRFAWNFPASPIILSQMIVIADDDSLEHLQKIALLQKHGESDDPVRKEFIRLSNKWIKKMEIDRSQSAAVRLFVLPGEPPLPNLPSWTQPPEIVIKDFVVDMYKVSIRYSTNQEGFLRAAFSWYPDLEVTLDGAIVETRRSLLGAIILSSPPGDHTLELVPVQKTNRWAVVLTLAGLLLAAGLYFAGRKN
ncbi:MAG: hypothetical protein KAV42_11230 [Candidatus Krumholzibacteria bacterium]|nr:hypothetical protein [Candidatus Krumholzibacteria bacterium]